MLDIGIPSISYCPTCSIAQLQNKDLPKAELRLFSFNKNTTEPWLVWLSGLSASLQTKGSWVQFPVRAQAWVAGQVPSRECERGNHTVMFLLVSGKRYDYGCFLKWETFGQDGGVGRYNLPPCTTKRRTATNLKTKITRNARKSNCMKV